MTTDDDIAAIRTYLNSLGLRYSDLSRMTGIPRSTLHRFLRQCRPPTLGTIRKLEAATPKRIPR